MYVDTHAGRGRHSTGEHGSPLIALRTFLAHSARGRILGTSEVVFWFVEKSAANAAHLHEEIRSLGELPPRVVVEVTCDDSFAVLRRVTDSLRRTGKNLAPAFVFVDPYGFRVPGRILRELMSFPRVELFVNVIWRELDMAIAQARRRPSGGMANTLDEVFDGRSWLSIASPSFERRADQCLELLGDLAGAKWATQMRMLGDNQVTRYVLLHLTNHDAGRDLMKDSLWKVHPSGDFYASRSDNPNQQILISPVPNLKPLEEWVLSQLEIKPRRWLELSDDVRQLLWREKQLNDVVRRLRNEGTIEGTEYDGRFLPSNDPLLRLSPGELRGR